MSNDDIHSRYTQSVIARSSSLSLAETMQLHETIKKQIEATNTQSRVMARLTWAAVVLAVVQVVASIIQVWLAFR